MLLKAAAGCLPWCELRLLLCAPVRSDSDSTRPFASGFDWFSLSSGSFGLSVAALCFGCCFVFKVFESVVLLGSMCTALICVNAVVRGRWLDLMNVLYVRVYVLYGAMCLCD